MAKKRLLNSPLVDSIAQNILTAIPIFRKRLLHMDVIQREFGIPLSHVQVLSMLSDHGTMTVSEISRHLGIAKPNITPLVNRLAEKELVCRARGDRDKRMVNVSISPKGEKQLAHIRGKILERVSCLADDISAKDLKALNDSLININRILGAAVYEE